MIVWCAYCQRFQGEQPPLDDYEVTHGLCARCSAKGAPQDDEAIAAIRPLAAFYSRLRTQARAGTELPTGQVLSEARSLGVRPLDLLLGMVQPALYEIGDLWSRGEMSVAMEHRFSANVQRIVDAIAEATPAPPPRRGDLDYLLVAADREQHTLGLRFVELFLREHGRSTFLVAPGLPAAEVLALVRSLEPRTLGLSVALPAHAAAVREISTALDGVPGRPRLIVGGYAIKMGIHTADVTGAEVVPQMQQLVLACGQPSQPGGWIADRDTAHHSKRTAR